LFTVSEMPKPIQIDGLAPLHRRRNTAGTKGKCIFCGRKTYRYISNKPVCSYCSGTEQANEVGPSWKRSILRTEQEGQNASEN